MRECNRMNRLGRGWLISRKNQFEKCLSTQTQGLRPPTFYAASKLLRPFHARSSRSPQSVLGVSMHASRTAIKARFRELAKQIHPDTSDAPDAPEKMTELIQAYDALMDDDLAGRIWGNGLAFTCEIYSVDELRAGNLFDVHAVRLLLEEYDAPTEDADGVELSPGIALHQATPCTALDITQTREAVEGAFLASLDDSVLDLKRALQSEYGQQWGLSDRQQNRQGLAMGWEVVFNGSALSYHLFLHDYGITHRDVVHAIVRRSDE